MALKPRWLLERVERLLTAVRRIGLSRKYSSQRWHRIELYSLKYHRWRLTAWGSVS